MTCFSRDTPIARIARASVSISIPMAVLALLLAGCAHTGESDAPAEARLPAAQPTAAVATIRTAGDKLDSAVQVQPLRDAAIDGALARARSAETAARYDEAVAEAEKALALDPTAPDILQYRAELEVLRGHWAEAEKFALDSFEHGPRVGSLCARNWQTVAEARTAMNDARTAEQAGKRLKECRVAPRVRM
jgi:tetratricopeptide (TPR) repeat protein